MRDTRNPPKQFLRRWGLSLLAATIGVCGDTAARNWSVELDGTGDFTLIQDAINVATSGDTISLGPGHFTDNVEFVYHTGVKGTAHCTADQDSLIITGAGRDLTFIGVDGYPPEGSVHLGIFSDKSPYISVSGISFISSGVISWGGDLAVSDSHFAYVGIGARDCGNVSVLGSRFQNDAWVMIGADNQAVVQDCEFYNGYEAISLWSNDALIERCSFESFQEAALKIGGNVRVENCTFKEAGSFGVYVGMNCIAAIYDCRFYPGGGHRIFALDGSRLTGRGNIFGPPTRGSTVRLLGPASATFTGNHILNGGGLSVYVSPGEKLGKKADPFPPIIYDFTGNYWGTTDREQIRAWISDIPDHGLQPRIVEFEPFLMTGVTTERRSFGKLKGLFGGGEE